MLLWIIEFNFIINLLIKNKPKKQNKPKKPQDLSLGKSDLKRVQTIYQQTTWVYCFLLTSHFLSASRESANYQVNLGSGLLHPSNFILPQRIELIYTKPRIIVGLPYYRFYNNCHHSTDLSITIVCST